MFFSVAQNKRKRSNWTPWFFFGIYIFYFSFLRVMKMFCGLSQLFHLILNQYYRLAPLATKRHFRRDRWSKTNFNWHFCSNKKSADFRMNFVKIILKMTSPFWVKVNNLTPFHLVIAENKSGTILHVFFHSWRYTWYSKNGASNEERFDLLGSSYC